MFSNQQQILSQPDSYDIESNHTIDDITFIDHQDLLIIIKTSWINFLILLAEKAIYETHKDLYDTNYAHPTLAALGVCLIVYNVSLFFDFILHLQPEIEVNDTQNIANEEAFSDEEYENYLNAYDILSP